MHSILDHRYFVYEDYISSLETVLAQHNEAFYTMDEIGISVLGNPIYKLQIGNGPIKILMWSQMHGNESTTTRSLLPFIEWFLNSELTHQLSLYIIPVLNPDGLKKWTRENANSVDLNRDAQDLSQPESVLLNSVFNKFKPDFCFNLHDQRTIYGTPDGLHGIHCSFLSPAADKSREITPSRLKAMHLINHITQLIKDDTNGCIGRYGDAFNANCVGDTFQSLGVPTVLFEAGQANADYYRTDTVNSIFKSLKCAVELIALDMDFDHKKVVEDYHAITTIETNFCDVLIKNVPSANHTVDLSIMYKEVLENDVLYFVPFLIGINDRDVKNALRVIDMNLTDAIIDFEITKGQKFVSNSLDIQIFY
ncbi:peptidase M14 [Nonlabens mediterrranea]|uniref:Peptidase M14 n=1 Tax=Nonlabens mediterrranea TaxID=1419947 RepID=A0ABS0A8T4_9FLAO|nr:peptidase M14 [Nonlabens mediterrranea]